MKTNISALRTANMLVVAASAVLFTFSAGDAAAAFCGERVCGKKKPPPPPPPPPPGSCLPSSSLSVLVQGTNVTSYVPKGNWSVTPTTGVSVINVEGTSITPTLIPTGADVVNSCASNPITGQTVCATNGTDVLILKGTTLSKTLTSGGSGSISFSGGSCTNCSVVMDAVHNKAAIGLSIAGAGGFQFLDLGTSTFEPAFKSPSGDISEDPLIDPTRNFLLSATESDNYEIVNVATTTAPKFFENALAIGEPDSSAEDCSTGIALTAAEGSDPSVVFIADLNQVKFTPGTPSGTWTAASQNQTLTESTGFETSGIAVAQGTHLGILSPEFGGDIITAFQLPATSGSGIPKITDSVTCSIGGSFSAGFDPHTVTAYQSPNGAKDAIALVANGGATTVVRVDLTKMLDKTIVPRDAGGHACATSPLPATVTTFIAVP